MAPSGHMKFQIWHYEIITYIESKYILRIHLQHINLIIMDFGMHVFEYSSFLFKHVERSFWKKKKMNYFLLKT